ncbi:NUDIX hydrolase [Herbiconiux sp. L3-i23]|uniref:NUDIX hydrolase n=1 Tax=Herbiconiux sp. L3-i23 TaxID=2905871 RepID=UPI0020664F0D|nr:NUDIX domain-containing protein [Herbiconiux sp. L3-i23]BDI22650.1 DNA mismatch repair protein MutT [Herbiconiux sp. L3-i23]
MAPVFRATSRVLLFDEDDRVLLFLQYGKSHDVAPRWITPGGGVDPGETHDDAAVREVQEETGLVLDSVPAAFWSHDFDADQRWHEYLRGHSDWYAVRVERFDPVDAGWTDEEKTDIVRSKWWSLDELAATDDAVEPADLAALARRGHATL